MVIITFRFIVGWDCLQSGGTDWRCFGLPRHKLWMHHEDFTGKSVPHCHQAIGYSLEWKVLFNHIEQRCDYPGWFDGGVSTCDVTGKSILSCSPKCSITQYLTARTKHLGRIRSCIYTQRDRKLWWSCIAGTMHLHPWEWGLTRKQTWWWSQ